MADKEKAKNNQPQTYMPDEETFKRRLAARHQRGTIGRYFYYFSILIAILALVTLFLNVINEAFGAIATVNVIEPETLTPEGRPLAELSEEELADILAEHVPNRLLVIVRENASQVDSTEFTNATLRELQPNGQYPQGYADTTVNEIREQHSEEAVQVWRDMLALNVSRTRLQQLVEVEVVQLQVVGSWSFFDALFNWERIQEEVAAEFPNADGVRLQSWLDREFLTTPMSSIPAQAGIRTALLGSIYMMIIVVLVSLPIGVGAAVYLEEYAADNLLNRIIETNVRNLAGVPSIIYGMLGLTIFVRVLAPFTSGLFFGVNVEGPDLNRIVQVIEEDVSFDLTVEGDDDFIIEETGEFSEAQIRELMDTFVWHATPSTRNWGGFSELQLAERIARSLDISITETEDSLPSDRIFEVTSGTIPDDTFNLLVNDLATLNSFTINGRTIVSAALTLALLILPIIIINAQEALRAVPYTIREASYGLGATKWQTIWKQVLPAAVPGILTGTILAVSRAVGETAPLIVVGASTFLVTDPTSPFSKFTALPIQIFNWTARPQEQFRDIAAAAIIVLLVLMLTLNATAIFLRNRYSIRY